VTACSIPRGAGVAQRILDRWSRSALGFSPFAKGQLRQCPSSRDNTLLSRPQFDHDLRGDSATEYLQSCSTLAESGSIILTAHTAGRSRLCIGGIARPIARVEWPQKHDQAKAIDATPVAAITPPGLSWR
jgi:hypothetical protein